MRATSTWPRWTPERLEPRAMLSSAFPNVNVSRTAGNQAEGAIAVDRADPSRLFSVANVDAGSGLSVGTSADGGATWARRTIADGRSSLPPACCDPSAAFDAFGNLFLCYLNSDTDHVVVLRSEDAGQTFSLLTQFPGKVDQPTLTTGPGSLWLTFQDDGSVAVVGAPVTGLGAVGSFLPVQHIRGSNGGNFGDVAVGPSGQVMVTYQKQAGNAGSKLYVSVDPNGLGGGAPFGKPALATTTHVTNFDFIPAQSSRGIDAEAGLAFDRSGGPFDGRAYLLYTEENPDLSGNTEIVVRYSDDQGATWSAPIRVNDDTTLNSQFNPRIAVDPTSGTVGVGWYDARNDLGAGGPGDTNGTRNDDVQYFATVLTPLSDGLSVAANQQVSAGTSNAADANDEIDLGDYSGLDFLGGTLHPLWFDNSNSTGDNPDGTLKDLDVYTASVPAARFAAGAGATTVALGGMTDPSGPVASLPAARGVNPGFVNKGNSYTVTVSYADPNGVSAASLGDGNIAVDGPNGFSATGHLLKTKSKSGGTSVLATYQVINPAGKWTPAGAGTYTVSLRPGQVADDQGGTSAAGTLGTFAVTTGFGNGSHPGSGGTRGHHRGGEPD